MTEPVQMPDELWKEFEQIIIRKRIPKAALGVAMQLAKMSFYSGMYTMFNTMVVIPKMKDEEAAVDAMLQIRNELNAWSEELRSAGKKQEKIQ